MTSSEVGRHTAVSEETQNSTFPAMRQKNSVCLPLLHDSLGRLGLFAKQPRNVRYLRIPAGWSRRIALKNSA
jgi:hypothetical protein